MVVAAAGLTEARSSRYDLAMIPDDRPALRSACDDVLEALSHKDPDAFGRAAYALIGAIAAARTDEIDETLDRLGPAIAEAPLGIGAHLAEIAGTMVGHGTTLTILPVLVERACGALEDAAKFAALWGDGELPDPEDMDLYRAAGERFAATAGDRVSGPEARRLLGAWYTAGTWTQPVLYLAQRKDVRRLLQRDRLSAAVEPMTGHISNAHWLSGLLLVLDDEPVTVVHRPTGRGYEIRISGIGDNFQLHTMLAYALIGDEASGWIPGVRPGDDAIAAATTGPDLVPPGGLSGHFNLVAADGTWIWNEGRPADIPMLDGRRVIVLDPPAYSRHWDAGRAYPLMVPELRVDRHLTAQEVAEVLV
jgi:hypothetical protein